MDLSEDEERITKLVSEGHDAACLFVEVGGDYVTFKKKQEQKKRIIDKLDSYIQSTVDTSNTNELTLSIEYAYFGFTDTYSYDMRRDVLCPSDDLINKGIDHWMKKIDSLKDIWKLVSRGSKISSVLKIRLNQANSLLNRHASLYIFDLHLLENKSKDEHYQNGIYYSFTSLRSIIERALGNTNDELKSEKIITNYYVLTHLLAPFACGHNELIILTYIQECLHTFRDETIMVLELVEMMRGIRILSLVNNSSINHERNSVHHLQKKLSVYKNKFEMAQSLIQQHNEAINHLQTENEHIRHLLQDNEKEYKKTLSTYNEQQDERIELVHKQVQEKQAAIKKSHQSMIIKIKKLAFYRISGLKKEKEIINYKCEQLQKITNKAIESKHQLEIKMTRLSRYVQEKEKKLLSEIKMMRKEKSEIRTLFNSFKKQIEQEVK